MDGQTKATPYRRSLLVIVLFSFLVVVCGFIFLWIISGGSLLAVLTAAAIIAVLASAHYLVWGRSMTSQRDVVYRDERMDQAAAAFPDTFTLPLDDRERAELLALLDQALAETAIQAGPVTPGTAIETATAREVLRGVRDRLQRYGA